MKKEDLFKRDLWGEIVDSSRLPQFKGDSAEARLKRILYKKLMENREELYDYLWNRLNEAFDLVDELDEKGCKAVREIGTKLAKQNFAALIYEFVGQSSKTGTTEGWALHMGLCETCDSTTCPVIKKLKPEQYKEEEEFRRKTPFGIFMSRMSMGSRPLPDEIKTHIIRSISQIFPFKIDENMLREKLDSGTFILNLSDIRKKGKSKTLADLLGISEEEARKWIKEEAEKGYTEELPEEGEQLDG